MRSLILLLPYLLVPTLVLAQTGPSCSGPLTVEQPAVIAKPQSGCSTRLGFESIEVVACRAVGKGLALSVSAKASDDRRLLVKDLGDATAIRSAMFKAGDGCEQILLVDHSAEFSYGVLVIVVTSKTAKYVGMIDAVADENGGSVLSSIRATGEGQGRVAFTFSTDIHVPGPDGSYRRVSRDRALYRYDSKSGLRALR